MKIARKLNAQGVATLSLIVAILMTGAAAHAYGTAWQGIPQPIPDVHAAILVGGLNWGACGIVAGIALGVVALGASTVTVGLGGAAVLSVGAHLAGLYCMM